jgi:hypothetical protein
MDDLQERTIEFTVMDFIPGRENPPTEHGTGTLVDLSESGLRFLTDAALAPGDLLAFTRNEFARKGIVMWTLRNNDQWNVGVRFVAAA